MPLPAPVTIATLSVKLTCIRNTCLSRESGIPKNRIAVKWNIPAKKPFEKGEKGE
jgi:hypothetical protein